MQRNVRVTDANVYFSSHGETAGQPVHEDAKVHSYD